jgi:hypothetical protein
MERIMGRSKINVGLDETIVDHIQAAPRGDQGAYIERLIGRHMQEHQEALQVLRAAGWTLEETFAACDALNGIFLLRSYPLGSYLFAELYDAQRLNDICANHGADPEKWLERCRQVREDATIAWAIWEVVWGFWTLHPWYEERIRRVLSAVEGE